MKNKHMMLVIMILFSILVALLVIDLWMFARSPHLHLTARDSGALEVRSEGGFGNSYVARSFLLLAFGILGVFLASWSLRTERPMVVKLLYLQGGVALFLCLYALYIWWKSGFDHLG